MNETGRFFIITGIDWEYGFLMEEVKGATKEGTVLLNNPLERFDCPEAYKIEDVVEISKENHDKIMKLHLDSAEEGWGDEEEDALQNIIKEVTSA